MKKTAWTVEENDIGRLSQPERWELLKKWHVVAAVIESRIKADQSASWSLSFVDDEEVEHLSCYLQVVESAVPQKAPLQVAQDVQSILIVAERHILNISADGRICNNRDKSLSIEQWLDGSRLDDSVIW